MSTNTMPRSLRARVARAAAVLVLLIAGWTVHPSRADAETSVPLDLQVDLVRKVIRFERGFAGRGGDTVHLVIVVRAGNSASSHAASQLQGAFERAGDLGGRPVKVTTYTFANAAALKKAVADAGSQLVFLTPGFDSDLGAIAAAFEGVPAVTVTTDGDQVEHGVVLGFELVASKPKITLNLAQAKKQGLDFNSDLFRLARVIQ